MRKRLQAKLGQVKTELRRRLHDPAGNRLERLRGAQSDRHSMRVNDQYRLTFRWEDGHAYEVCVEDYH